MIDLLGKGGMGEVYRAEDLVLGCPVALKLLPREAEHDKRKLELLFRETRIARTVSHPNVCRVHDISFHVDDAYGKVYFISMEFVPGENLKSLLRRIGRLPQDKAIAVSLELCAGLQAVHECGLLHRDIKPQNIMIDQDGRVRLADFGLAVMDSEKSAHAGTPAYMAPEQHSERRTSLLSDVYALGLVLYELFTGHQAFRASSVREYARLHLHSRPKVPSAWVPYLHPKIEKIILGCIEKLPQHRIPSVATVASSLAKINPSRPNQRGPLRSHSSGEKSPAPFDSSRSEKEPRNRREAGSGWASVAILPFTDMSPDQDQRYFCEGLAEDIINSLSNIRGLAIPSRTSVFSLNTADLNISEIGEKLKVKNILEGSLQKSGARLRVRVQLVCVKTGHSKWSRRFDARMEDIFAIQDEISSSIVGTLRAQLLEEAPVKRHSGNVAAYESYLLGRFEWHRRTEQALKRGIDYFHQAIEYDCEYARAYVGLADSYNILGVYFQRPDATFPLGLEAARRALALNSELAEAHVSKGYINLYYEWDWPAAERAFIRAIKLDPNYPFAYTSYFNLLLATGRAEEALALIRTSHELDPLVPIFSAGLGWAHLYMRDEERAISQLRRTVELDPGFALGRLWCGWAYQQKGQHRQAIAEIENAVILSGQSAISEGYLAHAHALADNGGEARRRLEALVESSSRRYVPAYILALVCTGLGHLDRAFENLGMAIDERFPYLIFLNHDPKFDGLRCDPRFDTLIRRIGLPDFGSGTGHSQASSAEAVSQASPRRLKK